MLINAQTAQNFLSEIEKAKKILLLTHLNPDADTLGSALACYDMLFRKQKKAYVYNASEEISTNLRALAGMDKIINTLPSGCDLAISFDCGDFNRLGIAPLAIPLINIDHHQSNEHYGTLNIIQTTCVSTTEVVYQLFNAAKLKISPIAAGLLYTGLVSDSLSFGTDRVDEGVFLMAADLVSKGAKPEMARELLFQSQSLGRVRLLQMMLETMELHHDGKTAIAVATEAMFEQSGAKRVDSDAALQVMMSLKVVETALILRQERPGVVKGSIRSKGRIDVNQLAARFGGGGHQRASGFEATENINVTKDRILKLIQKDLS